MSEQPPQYQPAEALPPPAYPTPQQGYVPPPEGYPPQQGYVQPPEGYPPPQQGYVQPPEKEYPPPQQGYVQPPEKEYPPPVQGYGQPPQQGYVQPPEGYPPPQQGYVQAPVPVAVQPQVAPVIVMTSFGNNSQRIVCTNCKTEQATVVRRKVGTMNWLVCGIIALVLCILGPELLIPFCLIPFAFIALCIPGLKDVEHVCPNCNYTNGVHTQL